MLIESKQDLARAYKHGPYTFPGGYPVYGIFSDSAWCCWECFKSEYGLIAESVKDQDKGGWDLVAIDINYEDTSAYCGHCSKHLESAYGED
jgi:hypothetical protein